MTALKELRKLTKAFDHISKTLERVDSRLEKQLTELISLVKNSKLDIIDVIEQSSQKILEKIDQGAAKNYLNTIEEQRRTIEIKAAVPLGTITLEKIQVYLEHASQATLTGKNELLNPEFDFSYYPTITPAVFKSKEPLVNFYLLKTLVLQTIPHAIKMLENTMSG
ncbi:unnamed protein product, partial [marine sediment metagenome]